jgi:thioredoxin-related protein
MQNRFLPILVLIAILFAAESVYSQESVPPQKENKNKNLSKADKIKWYSFEEAYKINKKKPRKIFIDVFTDWCGWCKRMDAETFTNAVIVKYMNKNFYCVKFDAERKDTLVIDGVTFVNPNPNGRRATHQLAVELLKGKMSYPSYVFLNEKSQWLTVVPGYQQAKDFESIIHYFGDDAYSKTPWEDYKTTFSGEIK